MWSDAARLCRSLCEMNTVLLPHTQLCKKTSAELYRISHSRDLATATCSVHIIGIRCSIVNVNLIFYFAETGSAAVYTGVKTGGGWRNSHHQVQRGSLTASRCPVIKWRHRLSLLYFSLNEEFFGSRQLSLHPGSSAAPHWSLAGKVRKGCQRKIIFESICGASTLNRSSWGNILFFWMSRQRPHQREKTWDDSDVGLGQTHFLLWRET